jgi:hypothetical protein
MNRLHKAVRDYLTMRRGLGFKLVRPPYRKVNSHEPGKFHSGR